MTNNNSNNGFLDEELNLAGLYGMNDLTDVSNQNLEDLAGYNLNASEWNMPMNNRNANGNERNMQSSNSKNVGQHEVNMPSNIARHQEQRQNQMVPQPQRQEQTMPTAKNTQENMNLPGNNNLGSMQPSGNIEDFLRTQIGKNVRMQFLVGTNTLIEKSGRLVAVGDNFVVLREIGSGEILICDFDGVKFIKFEDNSR